MSNLKTNYKDAELSPSMNGKRQYELQYNEAGYTNLVDKTAYTEVGDTFGADDINATNSAVNELNQNLNDIPNNAPYHGTIGFYAGQSWVLVVPISTYIIQNYNITNVGNVTLEGSGATLTVTRMDKKNNALICVLSGSSDVGNVGSVNLSFTKKN